MWVVVYPTHTHVVLALFLLLFPTAGVIGELMVCVTGGVVSVQVRCVEPLDLTQRHNGGELFVSNTTSAVPLGAWVSVWFMIGDNFN